MQEHTSDLAERLMELGYIELFQRLNEDALNSVWEQQGAAEALSALAVNNQAPALARFLAAEVLFSKQEDYPPEGHQESLSPVYAQALKENYTEVANPWGLPDVEDGASGEHFVMLGEAAMPELVRLLSDDTRLQYAGSKEATIGSMYCYRVKDLAAYYISRIRNIPFEVDQDPDRRDEEIARLRSALE